MSKSYLTVRGEAESVTEIKRSKFIATIAHVEDGDSAEAFVRKVRKKYSDATHNCYAYIADERTARFSDDGEPGGTAGQPMLEVLKKQELVGVAVVVTRYFGGIKLGAGGLVAAYTDSVSRAVAAATKALMTECAEIAYRCTYQDASVLERALNAFGAKNVRTGYGEGVEAAWCVPRERTAEALALVEAQTSGRVRAEVTDIRYEAM